MDKALTEGYQVKLTLRTINPQEFVSLALQACQQLGWRLSDVSEEGALLYTNGSAASYEEEIRIYLIDDKAIVGSRCVSEYLYDQKQNINNILAFRSALNILHNNYLQRKNAFHNTGVAPTLVTPTHLQNGWGGLIPSKRHLITPILIYINVFILLLMMLTGISPIDPQASSLLIWGGNFRGYVVDGEYWRLFTYMFLHGGLAHLAGNVFALLFIGLHLEPLLGKARYLSAYILTGIIAGVASMLMHGHSVGVGASGAIFGLYGVFLALLTTPLIKGVLRQTLSRSLMFFIVYSLLMGLQGNTDNAAHVGGLVSGMIIGYFYINGLKKPQAPLKQFVMIAVMAVGTIALTGGVIFYLRQLL